MLRYADDKRTLYMSDRSRRSASGPLVRPMRLVDHLVEEIQGAIAEGEYSVGERLPSEMALASRYGVGRSTVREALRVLSHIGQVSTRTGSGSVVVDINSIPPVVDAAMTIKEMTSIFTFRYSLEIPAVEIAASRRTTQQMRSMKRYIRDLKEGAKSRDLDAFSRADLNFHTVVIEAAGYDFAARIYMENKARFELAVKILMAQGGPLEPSKTSDPVERLHDKLLGCLERKDAKGAVRAVKWDQHEVQIHLDFMRRNARAEP